MTRSYRFGEFRLDPATRELWRGGSPVAVPPRAFDCIVYLVEHRDRAVGRDELIAAVWGRTETGDGTLGQTVLAARRALDDTGKEQQVIRTVFRFGYHWVAPVEVVEDSAPAAADDSIADEQRATEADATEPPRGETPIPRRRGPPLPAALAAVLIVLAALAIAYAWIRRATPPDSTPASGTQATLAMVLPVTVSATPGYDWVRLGVMDLVGARLRSSGLAVVPSDNVVALTGPPGPIDDIPGLARSAGANLVIEPRAEQSGETWRVTLRTVLGRDPPLVAVGEAPDVLAAARAAADRLARELGIAPQTAPPAANDGPGPSADLLQRIEAARLADRLDEARALIAGVPPDQRASPELRLLSAEIDYQAGDFDAAEGGFEAVAKAASAEQDPVLHARATSNLGVIAAIRDDDALAHQRFDGAVSLLRSQRAPDALGKALNGRANVSAQDGDFDAALHDFAEARIAFESTGNLLALAVLDSNLAAMDMHRFHYAEAEPAFLRSAERFGVFGVHAAELNALTAAAELDIALLQPDAALALEPRLRELIADVADPARKRYGELTRIEVLVANGRIGEARTSLDTIADAARAAGDRAATTRTHSIAADLAMTRGDSAPAAAEARSALDRYTDADDVRARARTGRLRVRALLDAGRAGDANAESAALSRFAAKDASAPARLYADLAAADCAAAAGDASAAERYRHALDEADALRIPLDLRDVVASYTAWLVSHGDLARAGATAERVAAWAARDYGSALVQLRVQHALGDASLWRSALARVRTLAGERAIPAELTTLPEAS